MPLNRPIRSAFAVAVLGLGAAACAGSGGGGAHVTLTPPAVVGSASPSSWWAANNALPLSAYLPSNGQDTKIFQAQVALTVQCVHKQGFADYDGSNLRFGAQDPAQELASGTAGPWGYIDLANAQQRGFNPDITHVDPSSSAPLPAAEANQSRTCNETAVKDFPLTEDATGLVQNLEAAAVAATATDSRVAAATKSWASCMSGQGYPVSDPAGLGPAGSNQLSLGAPTPAQVAEAVADVDCTTSSDLGGVYFAVLAGYQKELIQQNIVALNSLQQANQNELTKAATAISG